MKILGVLGFLGSLGGVEIIILMFIVPLLFAGFAFLNGKIAQRKGYPFWAGAISAFIHIFGTILFLVLPFNKDSNSAKKQINTRQCSYCGEEILVIAKKCKHCGEWFENK